jgi:hypothetical protein
MSFPVEQVNNLLLAVRDVARYVIPGRAGQL